VNNKQAAIDPVNSKNPDSQVKHGIFGQFLSQHVKLYNNQFKWIIHISYSSNCDICHMCSMNENVLEKYDKINAHRYFYILYISLLLFLII